MNVTLNLHSVSYVSDTKLFSHVAGKEFTWFSREIYIALYHSWLELHIIRVRSNLKTLLNVK